MGLKAWSPLHLLPQPFSFIFSVPPEEFHLIKEGLTKLIIRRLFESTSAAASQELLGRWSDIYESAQVFSETPRRTKAIQTSMMKGSELGYVAYAGFPVLVDLLEDYEGEVW